MLMVITERGITMGDIFLHFPPCGCYLYTLPVPCSTQGLPWPGTVSATILAPLSPRWELLHVSGSYIRCASF